MKINTNVYKQYVKSGNSKVSRSFFYGGTEKASVEKKDSFSLSSEASMFRQCGGVIKDSVSEITAPASKSRINTLRQQIADGSYNVSSGQVADAILDRIV